ncbi:MAG: hypothetical protein ACYC8T_06890 [Myxococcaceae bacterium]
MPLFSRPDGTLATDVPPVRRIMPFIMPTRNESAVYFEQEIDLTRTLPFIEAFNASHPRRVTVFHVFLWAVTRALNERPRLNRFVMGSRIYQRDGIWLSFSAKKSLSDDAPIVTIKRRFDPAQSFEELVEFVYGDLGKGRSDEKSHVDKEISWFLKLPSPVLRLGVKLLRWLDRWNLLPGSYIRPDPMYASMFVANLGSVRLESAYHHLYEYGNCPFFAAIGRKRQVTTVDAQGQPATRTTCSIKYTFDERVEDGLYCASSLELLRAMIEDPAAHAAVGAGAGPKLVTG